MFSDKAVRSLMTTHGGEVLPGEGKLLVPSTTIVVPAFTLSRGGDVTYNAYPTGDVTLAAFAAIVGGDGLQTRLANAFRRAMAGKVESKHIDLVKEVKELIKEEVKAPRRAPLVIEV